MKTPRFLVAAGISLALAFTFSCSSDSSDDPTPVQSSSSADVQGGSSSSVDGGSSSSVGGQGSSSSVGTNGGGHFNQNITYGSLTDSRDGKTYRTVVIGTQIWMAENLNYEDGGKCYGESDQFFVWDEAGENLVALSPEEIEANCTKYGRLYDWATAMDLPSSCNSSTCASQVQSKHRGICPSGWHIPSDGDWSQLFDYIGGSSVAGMHLKAKTGWSSCGPSGSGSLYSCEDTHGFSALPGGNGSSDGRFHYVGGNGLWWSASEYNSSHAYCLGMRYYHEDANWSNSIKPGSFSVRCVQDW